jgi:intracellular sulfur oxidation DsrE/DsrF family protein
MTNGSIADRRTILGAGALVAGAGALAGAARAQDGGGASGWQPAREDIDSWLDKPGTRHRMMFDSVSADAAGRALHFANNVYLANQSGYGIGPEALGILVILRAMATGYGFNDAMWAKYNKAFVTMMKLEGDEAEKAKTANPLLAGSGGGDDEAVTLSMLHGKGARFAVCGMATHGASMYLAKSTGGDAAAIEAELKANLIPGAVIVPAGILAVGRAQEHGYAFAYVI